jgi:hypothetical protein
MPTLYFSCLGGPGVNSIKSVKGHVTPNLRFCIRLHLLVDEDITALDTNDTPPLDIQGAITRARARQLNLEVSSFLSKALYVNVENSILPNDYILLRNKGQDQEGDGEGLRDGGDQQRRLNQVRGPSVSPTRSPGAGSTKTDAQVAYGLRLGHFSYARKAKKTTYPMVLVPYQNSI